MKPCGCIAALTTIVVAGCAQAPTAPSPSRDRALFVNHLESVADVSASGNPHVACPHQAPRDFRVWTHSEGARTVTQVEWRLVVNVPGYQLVIERFDMNNTWVPVLVDTPERPIFETRALETGRYRARLRSRTVCLDVGVWTDDFFFGINV